MFRLTTIILCVVMLCSCTSIKYGISLMESISDDLAEASSNKKK